MVCESLEDTSRTRQTITWGLDELPLSLKETIELSSLEDNDKISKERYEKM